MADRVRMNTLSLATAALAQTPLLARRRRPAALEVPRPPQRQLGDWFNVLDWSKRTNGFGRGLTRPGVVVMQVDDTVGRDVDTGLDGCLWSSTRAPETVTVPVDGLAGRATGSPVRRRAPIPSSRRRHGRRRRGPRARPAGTVAVFVDGQRPGKPGKPGKPGGHHAPSSGRVQIAR